MGSLFLEVPRQLGPLTPFVGGPRRLGRRAFFLALYYTLMLAPHVALAGDSGRSCRSAQGNTGGPTYGLLVLDAPW